MNNFKAFSIAILSGFCGALTFYSIQVCKADSPIATTNSEGRRVQIWLDQIECDNKNSCSECLAAIAKNKKLEVLIKLCPDLALQWKYE